MIALLTMTADHLAWAFLPTVSLGAALLHLAGRISMPVFCFLLAEGAAHTRHAGRYAFRLAGCALLSAIPYSLLVSGTPLGAPFSAAYTLLLSLAALRCIRSSLDPLVRVMLLIPLLFFSQFGDWGIYAVGWCVLFSLVQERQLCGVLFLLLTLCNTARFALPLIGTADPFTLFCEAGIQLGSLLALPLIFRCNGRRRRPGHGAQFLEYLYYPLHLVLIDLFLF